MQYSKPELLVTMTNENLLALSQKFKEARYTDGATIGNVISALAMAFSHEADTNGLFMLEETLAEAKKLKDFDTRSKEYQAIMDRIDAQD